MNWYMDESLNGCRETYSNTMLDIFWHFKTQEDPRIHFGINIADSCLIEYPLSFESYPTESKNFFFDGNFKNNFCNL